MFENLRKSLIEHCERSASGQKLIKNAKNAQFGEFLNFSRTKNEDFEQCELIENAKKGQFGEFLKT